jgi:lysophospholipase L1-like esterase
VRKIRSEKISVLDIVNDLTTGGTAVPLSAEQGKTLQGEVGTLASLSTTEKGSLVGAINENNALISTKVDITDIVDDLTTDDATRVLSAKQGVVLHGSLSTHVDSNIHKQVDNCEQEALYSNAEGSGSIASGVASHAEGMGVEASGLTSHAEGTNAIASGDCSHAEGWGSVASGDCSHAQNDGTIAQGDAQTALGRYNVAQGGETPTASDYILIIGNGEDEDNRSNALAVQWDGTLVLPEVAKINIGGAPLETRKPILVPYDVISANPSKNVLLNIGDSLTATGDGYTYFLNNTLHRSGHPRVDVDRLAVGGYRWGDMYSYVVAHLAEYPEANTFTILLGTNDTKTTNSNTWFDRMSSMYYAYMMVKYLKEQRPNSDIRIMQIPWISPDTTDPTFLPNNQWEANKDEMNRMLRCLARNLGAPEALDLYALTVGKSGYYLSDGLHFNGYGYKHIAPAIMNLLKQVPQYTADRDYLTGRDYTISGGNTSGGYGDWSGNTHDTNYMKKLTKGNFYTIDSSVALTEQVGFAMGDNGGLDAKITVEVTIPFGEEVVLNDVGMYVGNGNSYGYTPDLIKIYSYDGSTYNLEGTLDPAQIRPSFPTQLLFFNVFMPDKPFKTQGLKLVFEKTFLSGGRDWLFIGEIAATRLNDYKGEITNDI